MSTPQTSTLIQNPVKRTFWFGMLGVLVSTPTFIKNIVIFIVVLVNIHTDTLSKYNIQLRKNKYTYDLLNKLVRYEYFQEMMVIFAVLFYAIIFWSIWYLSRNYFKSDLSLRKSYSNTANKWKNLSIRTILIVLIIIISCLPVTDGFYIIVNPLESTPFVLSFINNPIEATCIYSLLQIPVIPYVFSVYTLVCIVIMDKSFDEFKSSVKVTLFGIIFFAGVLLLVTQFQKHLDIKDGFKDISGFSMAREPRSLIILKDTAYSVKLADVFEDNVQNAGGIPFNKENYKAVMDYIGSKNGFTCDRKVGYEFLVMSKLRELDQSQALETDYGAFSQTGDVFEGMLLVTGIYTSSDKKEYKRILYGITDENHVSINGLVAAKISHVFVRFGDMDKALHWYNKYIETSTNADDRQKELYKPPHMPPFHNGVISGRFLLNGLSDGHVSVGVIKAATSDSMMQYASEHGGKSNIWNLINLADGTITDSEGRFTFTGLGEDEYVLLLSLEDMPGKKYRVINSPGAIRVSENNPSVDVGSINLELEPAKPEKL